LGLPIAFALTSGEVSDYKGYLPLMDADGPAPKVLLADKGYDADFIRADMERRGGIAMIPTKRNRRIQLPVDAAIYALRNMVERWLACRRLRPQQAQKRPKASDPIRQNRR
jgi:transposase